MNQKITFLSIACFLVVPGLSWGQQEEKARASRPSITAAHDVWQASGTKGAVVAGGVEAVQAGTSVLQQGGNAVDAAVATLLATQFALAAMNRANDQSDDRTQSLRGDCFAGAYTASVILGNRAETSSFRISPGDLDEAITALLVFRGDGDTERQGAGFERIRHYRDGVLNGAGSCLKN